IRYIVIRSELSWTFRVTFKQPQSNSAFVTYHHNILCNGSFYLAVESLRTERNLPVLCGHASYFILQSIEQPIFNGKYSTMYAQSEDTRWWGQYYGEDDVFLDTIMAHIGYVMILDHIMAHISRLWSNL
ncbi:hypothetical protein CEXT_781901, partial [Caerostris extrusa]